MIEIEKKFLLKSDDIARLTEGATFIKEITMLDIYYDDATYSLTTKDRWLRERDGKFELKEPAKLEKWSERLADQYHEIEDEAAIAAALKISGGGSLRSALKAAGYEPFATIKTVRRKYKNGEFGIDIDTIDFGYDICEIELMIPEESQMVSAVKRIVAFAEARGLRSGPVRGKVLEYLHRFNPKHLEILQTIGMAG